MNKLLHRLLMFLIFLSVSEAAYLLLDAHPTTPPHRPSASVPKVTTKQTLTPTVLENSKTTSQTTNNNTDKASRKSQLNTEKKQSTNTTLTPAITKATSEASSPVTNTETSTIPIKLVISDVDYDIQVKPNSTAYEAMLHLQQAGKIAFTTKNFSSLGYFIESINGKKNSPMTGFYWTYYINNEEAKLGVSNYIVKPNDLITWKYENK